MSNINTISELINATNLDKLEIKLLLRHVLGLSSTELIIYNDRILNTVELAKFDCLVKQRLSGLPLHYILGYKEFYSREFRVTTDTLIPRPETEFLVDEVLKIAKPGMRILDLGTGTGCIAITCNLELPSLDVTAVDKFPETLEVAKTNAQTWGANIHFIHSDWYEDVSGKFDVIVSNPPYIEKYDPHLTNLQYEPQHALTDFNNGLTCYEKIISGAHDYLVPAGHIILEHGYAQKDSVTKILQEHGFKDIHTVKDYANLDRITSAQLF